MGLVKYDRKDYLLYFVGIAIIVLNEKCFFEPVGHLL